MKLESKKQRMKRCGAVLLMLAGTVQISIADLEPYSENFSSAQSVRKWEKIQETPSTTVKWHRDGYMIIDVQDGDEANESIGYVLGGTLDKDTSIKTSVQFANIHNNYYKVCIQLWNSKDNVLLVESEVITVYGANNAKYQPMNLELNYGVKDSDEGAIVQLRIVEKCNGLQRDIVVDSISVISEIGVAATVNHGSHKKQMSQLTLTDGLSTVPFSTADGMPLSSTLHIYQLGAAMPTVNVRSSDFGYLPDGRPVAFATSNGEPLTFYVLDMNTGKKIDSKSIPDETLAGSVYQSSDGSVYFNVTQATPGTLFRYVPEEQKLTRIGERIEGEQWLRDVVSDPDGTLFISTYPSAKLLAYDPQTGKFRDYGSVVDDVTYAYTAAVVGDEVWVGTGPVANLIAVDKKTGRKRTVQVPEKFMSNAKYIVKLETRENRVFAQFSPKGEFDSAVYDIRTQEWSHIPAGISGSGITEADKNGVVYFLSNRSLYSFNLETGHIKQTNMAETQAGRALRGAQRIYDIGLIEIDGKIAVVGMTNTGNLWRYFPLEGTGDIMQVELQESAAKVVGFGVGPDGKVYAGAKIGVGKMARIDPATHKIEALSGPSQAEGVGGKGNTILIGDYSGAGLNIGDLSKPWKWGANPRQLFKLGRGGPYYQDRIWAIEEAGSRIALGTIPEPGQNGGTLTFVDPITGEYEVHRNVVENQSIVDLVYRDGLLYGATSISGGAGTPNQAKEACLFIWDVNANKKVWEGAPIPNSPIINGLTWTPDGMLWGISETGEVFEFDPHKRIILRTKSLDVSKNMHGWGNHSSLVYNARTDEFVGTAGGRLFVLDRASFNSQMLNTEYEILRLVRSGNGNIYGVGETQVYFIDLRL